MGLLVRRSKGMAMASLVVPLTWLRDGGGGGGSGGTSTSAADVQLTRDVVRDTFAIAVGATEEGATVVGSECGVDGLVAAVVSAMARAESAAATAAPAAAAAAPAEVRRVLALHLLRAASRTSSGGDALDAVVAVLQGRGPAAPAVVAGCRREAGLAFWREAVAAVATPVRSGEGEGEGAGAASVWRLPPHALPPWRDAPLPGGAILDDLAAARMMEAREIVEVLRAHHVGPAAGGGEQPGRGSSSEDDGGTAWPPLPALTALSRAFGILGGGRWHLVAESEAASAISLRFTAARPGGADAVVDAHRHLRPDCVGGGVSSPLSLVAAVTAARERRSMASDVAAPPLPGCITAGQLTRWRRLLCHSPPACAPHSALRQWWHQLPLAACRIEASVRYRVVTLDDSDVAGDVGSNVPPGTPRPPVAAVIARYRRTVVWPCLGPLSVVLAAAVAPGDGTGTGVGVGTGADAGPAAGAVRGMAPLAIAVGGGGSSSSDDDDVTTSADPTVAAATAAAAACWRDWRAQAVACGVAGDAAARLASAALASHPGLAHAMLQAVASSTDVTATGDGGGSASAAWSVYESASEVQRALPLDDTDRLDCVELVLSPPLLPSV